MVLFGSRGAPTLSYASMLTAADCLATNAADIRAAAGLKRDPDSCNPASKEIHAEEETSSMSSLSGYRRY